MAATAHKTEEEKKEYFDSPEELDTKINLLAKIIKDSQHFIAFTGAGISTSTGIPDFRSGVNTVLETGPGAWEKKAVKMKAKKGTKSVPMLKAIPSPTHMCLVQLERKGILKYLISQNVDGLHRRSGFDPEKLAELHGNTNLEFCDKCGKKYLRDFRVRNASSVHSHQTGRLCSVAGCKGKLFDSIINFGESLPQKDMNEGFLNSKMADVCLSLGSSLRVTPAADMPSLVAERNKKLVIVNLQRTPLDSMAYLCIHALCDTVMEKLAEKLELTIPKFTLTRRVKIQRQGKEIDQQFLVQGIDSDDVPYSLFRSVELRVDGAQMTGLKEPFLFKVKDKIKEGKLSVNLKFQQNYQEPDLKIDVILAALKDNKPVIYIIEYNPSTGKWVNVIEKLQK